MNSDLEKLKNGIFEIGQKLVCCNFGCEGISNKPEDGIIPRCLFYEHENRQGNIGCVVVGINPGRSSKNSEETNYYLKNYINNNPTYNSVVEYWKRKYWTYYKYLKVFVNCVGYDGPILWTELAKCENDKKAKKVPLQTFRNCTHRFLREELELIPTDWPLIAVGREAHKALSYLYPTKSVLGIPHPTSSHGEFSQLFINNREQFVDNVKIQMEYFNKNIGKEIWLTAKK